MKIIIVTALYTIFFVVVELVTKTTRLDKEVSRKIVHILAATSAAFLPLVMSFREIAYLSLLFLPVMMVSKRVNLFSSIHQVQRKTYGEVFFPVAILITALLFPHQLEYSYGLFILGISDGFASVIGQKYGRKTYRIGAAHKSYLGSLVFALSAWLTGIIVLMVFGQAVVLSIALTIPLAVILTLVEASSSSGIDNLILPPLASGLMLGLFHFFRL